MADKSKVTGIVDSQNDVDGWPETKSTPAPKDTDQDDMPDEWETMHGLDSNDVNDGHTVAEGGYTMLEEYLNSSE